MIHILTIHHQDDRFVNLQLEALKRHISEPFEVWAVCDGLSIDLPFDHIVSTPFTLHGPRLDTLAATVMLVAKDDDVLIFLDGDAWPVAPLFPFVRDTLTTIPLVAVRRDEAPGGPWPHPLFCATTVGFWRSLGAFWTPAYWHSPEVALRWDVAAGVGNRLYLQGIQWAPLLRRNGGTVHPLWFALYGPGYPLVYHHGAGFREKFSLCSRVEDTKERIERIGAGLLEEACKNSDFWKVL